MKTADTGGVSDLIETLAAELERPRELSARVMKHLTGTYGIDYEAIGPFLVNELPKLEDDEIDLILSPVFTPKLADQAVFAELLCAGSVPRNEWPRLVRELAARPVRAQLVTIDGRPHTVVLREVTIERYVYRLRLEGAIPESLLKLIERDPSTADRPILKAVARRAVWENDSRRNILERYLATAAGRGGWRASDAVELLNLVESYKHADVADLLAWIPPRREALREQINTASGPKPFFNERVQELHGGDRDQRHQDDSRISAKQNEFEFLERLQNVLAES